MFLYSPGSVFLYFGAFLMLAESPLFASLISHFGFSLCVTFISIKFGLISIVVAACYQSGEESTHSGKHL